MRNVKSHNVRNVKAHNESLANEIYHSAFLTLDGEPFVTGSEAGQVATACEMVASLVLSLQSRERDSAKAALAELNEAIKEIAKQNSSFVVSSK